MDTKDDKEKSPAAGCLTGAALLFIISAVGLAIGIMVKGKDFVNGQDGSEAIENLRYLFFAIIIAVVIWLFNRYRKK